MMKTITEISIEILLGVCGVWAKHWLGLLCYYTLTLAGYKEGLYRFAFFSTRVETRVQIHT